MKIDKIKNNETIIKNSRHTDLVNHFNELCFEMKNKSIERDIYYQFFKIMTIYYDMKNLYINATTTDKKKIAQDLKKAESNIVSIYSKKIENIIHLSIKNIENSNKKKKYLIILSHLMSNVQDASNNFINGNSKNYFENQQKLLQIKINNNIFKGKVNSFNQFIGFLDNTERPYIPLMISLFMCTNINNIDNDLHISPSIVFNRKNGDCTEYTFMADFLLKRHGFETMPVDMVYNNKSIGHSVCLFKDTGGKWDLIDTNGYWNKNWDEPLGSTREMFKDVKEMHLYNVDYTLEGKFVSEVKDTKIYP